MFLTVIAYWCEFAVLNALLFCFKASVRSAFHLGNCACRAVLGSDSGSSVYASNDEDEARKDVVVYVRHLREGFENTSLPLPQSLLLSYDDYSEL